MKKYAFVGRNVAQNEFCKTINYQAREKLQNQIQNTIYIIPIKIMIASIIPGALFW